MTRVVTGSGAAQGIETTVPPQDPRLIHRIVGFHEYGTALTLLQDFVKRATEDELAAAEEIVKSRPELGVEINLSRHIQGTTFFAEPVTKGDDFKRLGLAWVMGLARIELGAMLAGFSSVQHPFRAVVPTAFDKEAYSELLTDGMRTHYWSLKRDPVVKTYFKTGVPTDHIVTYGRRVSVARHFIDAVREYFGGQMLAIQRAELAAEESEIKSLQLIYIYCISKKQIGASRVDINQAFAACPPLVQAAQKELTANGGSARSRQNSGIKFGNLLHDVLVTVEPRLITVPCR